MKVRDEELAESRKEATDRGTTAVRLPVSVTMHRARALVGAIEDTEAELLQWKLTYSRGIIASGHEVTRRDREAEKIKANFETAQYNIQKLRQENTVLTNEMSRLREQKRSLNSQLARNSTAMSSGDQEGAIYDIENEMRLKQTLIDRNERFIEVAMSQIQTTGNAHVSWREGNASCSHFTVTSPLSSSSHKHTRPPLPFFCSHCVGRSDAQHKYSAQRLRNVKRAPRHPRRCLPPPPPAPFRRNYPN